MSGIFGIAPTKTGKPYLSGVKNIPYVPEDFFGEESDLKELSRIALAWAKINLQGKVIQNPALGEIHLSREGLKHTLYKDYKDKSLTEKNFAQIMSTAVLDKMVAKGTLLPPVPDNRQRNTVQAAHYLRSRVRVGENTYDVIIVVREVLVAKDNARKHFYDHAVIL